MGGLDDTESERIRVGGGRGWGTEFSAGSGELVRSITSCAQFNIVLWPFLCGGRVDLSAAGSLTAGSSLVGCDVELILAGDWGSSSGISRSLSSSESDTIRRGFDRCPLCRTTTTGSSSSSSLDSSTGVASFSCGVSSSSPHHRLVSTSSSASISSTSN